MSISPTEPLSELYSQIDDLKYVISQVPGHIYWKNRDGVYLGCNLQQAVTLGFKSTEDIIGKTDYDLPWDSDASQLRSIDEEVMTTQKIYLIEEPVTLPDGSSAIFLSKKAPLLDMNSNVKGILGVSFDITAEKQAQQLSDQKHELEHKVNGMNLLASAMAHDLRTPLAGLNAGANGLAKYLPKLIEAYHQAAAHNLVSDTITSNTLKTLTEIPNALLRQSVHSNLFIDMMLANIKAGEINDAIFDDHSIKKAIDDALMQYPFTAQQEIDIDWNSDGQDFLYHGSAKLTLHILFNLIKNALYFIQAAGKGQITIRLDSSLKQVIFTDTGKGIAEDVLPHIFERFYNSESSGTGVGLSFCQNIMQSYNGSIRCESKLGEYTRFILQFPD